MPLKNETHIAFPASVSHVGFHKAQLVTDRLNIIDLKY